MWAARGVPSGLWRRGGRGADAAPSRGWPLRYFAGSQRMSLPDRRTEASMPHCRPLDRGGLNGEEPMLPLLMAAT